MLDALELDAQERAALLRRNERQADPCRELRERLEANAARLEAIDAALQRLKAELV